LWLGTTKGLVLFTPGGKPKWFTHQDKSNSLSSNYIYRLAEDNKGRLWIGTEKGLNCFDPEKSAFTSYVASPLQNSVAGNHIKSVFCDSRGNIWIGTQGNGVSLYNPATNSFTNYRWSPSRPSGLCYNDILSCAEDSRGRIWIGTENGGISIFDYATGGFRNIKNNTSDPFSLSSNSVYCLYKDDSHGLWVGTWSGGVNFLPASGEKFTLYQKIPGSTGSLNMNGILSVSGDADGNIWIGTDGGGINFFDRKTKVFSHFTHSPFNTQSINSNYVLSVTQLSKEMLAIGYHRGGFDFYNRKTERFTHHMPQQGNPNSLPSSTVTTYKDKKGNLWLTTWGGGLCYYNIREKTFRFYRHNEKDETSIGNDYVTNVYEDREGWLWVSTVSGLNVLLPGQTGFIRYQSNPEDPGSLPSSYIEPILEDSAGNLWLGTKVGLSCFRKATGTFAHFTEKHGLASNVVQSILMDKKGNLWLGTNKGISRFDPVAQTFRNYDVTDGLQGNEFRLQCAYQTEDGEMFFGGSNGLNSFYPEDIADNPFMPPVYLTEFEIFNKPVNAGEKNSPLTTDISETKTLDLSYKDLVFTLEFAALNYVLPQKNQYAYKLEGFDKDWNFIGSRRRATYTNLDPGTYTFRVIASNNDGVWNSKGVSIQIVVHPPFWATWWFSATMALAAAFTAYGLYRFRVKTIHAQKARLQLLVQQQTALLKQAAEEEQKARKEAVEAKLAIEAANKALAQKNVELEQFVYVASHDLQEPLRTTASFVDLLQRQYKGNLDERADKYLTFILQSSERMKVLIRDLLEYSRIGRKKDMRAFDCNKAMQEVVADLNLAIKERGAEIRFQDLPVIDAYPTEVKQLFQNLVANALKFRKPGVQPLITISGSQKEDAWEFVCKDNGIGIDPVHKERIFVIFQRLHTRTEYEGSGIGLANCKKIVELHGGNIWVESSPGEGAAFYFTIPHPEAGLSLCN
jgi:signal transduction histidine kinase/ligand-binding sensor domain-containing protein